MGRASGNPNCLLIPFTLNIKISGIEMSGQESDSEEVKPVEKTKPLDKNELEEKLKRAIIGGSVLAGIYFFDQITADEWYEKDKDGNFKIKRKDLFHEIFE